MSDFVFGFIAVAAIGFAIAVRSGMRRAMKRYYPEGAFAEADAVPGQPFRLALPAGPCELMIRYVVEGVPRSGARGVDVGLTALIEVQRPGPDGAATELRREVGMGRSAPKLDAAERVTAGVAYALERDGKIVTATRVLVRLAGGGPGEASGRIEMGYGHCLGLTVFVR